MVVRLKHDGFRFPKISVKLRACANSGYQALFSPPTESLGMRLPTYHYSHLVFYFPKHTHTHVHIHTHPLFLTFCVQSVNSPCTSNFQGLQVFAHQLHFCIHTVGCVWLDVVGGPQEAQCWHLLLKVLQSLFWCHAVMRRNLRMYRCVCANFFLKGREGGGGENT